MPIVTFDKRYLKRLVGGGIDDKKLAEEIGRMGMGVEKESGEEISVEITSNRPDLVGAVGLARALQLYSHRSKKYRYTVKDGEPAFEVNVGRAIGDTIPFIAAFAVTGLHFTEDSLADLLGSIDKFTETYGRARRKLSIGVYNLSEVRPPLSYDAYADGELTPLGHSARMTYAQVAGETDKGRRYAGAIPKGARTLYPALKDSRETIALIPILNSERTKVTASTRSVLVDVTGLSEYMVNKVADMLASIFIDMGGEVRKGQVNYPGRSVRTPLMTSHEITLPVATVEKEIGVEIGPNNVASLAAKMGYEAVYIGDKARFTVPAYRLDVINEQDIVEDMAIAYGYEYINPVALRSVQAGSLDSASVYRSKVEETMIGLGFDQMMNSYLSNEALNFSMMRLGSGAGAIRLRNPKSETNTMLRTWLLPSLLRNVSLSLNERMPLSAFELDMAFSLRRGKPVEEYRLGAVSADPKANFNTIKSSFIALAEILRIGYALEPLAHRSFIEGRCARIVAGGGAELGLLGEIHPEVMNVFSIDEPTVAFELLISGGGGASKMRDVQVAGPKRAVRKAVKTKKENRDGRDANAADVVNGQEDEE